MRPFFSSSPSSLLLLLLAIPFVLSAAAAAGGAPSGDVGVSAAVRSEEQQAVNPGDFSPAANTVPAFPLVGAPSNRTCRLDLSDELFGGVAEACGGDLDRGRCCPVLAAWLFTAHARSALEVRAGSPGGGPPGSELPMMPDDSQRCVDALQGSLRSRGIRLARPNATCDAVLCFCGIRLHQISSLSCPAAFNLSSVSVSSSSPPSSGRKATPTAAVRELERSCRNSSYAGCTRCLESLDKLMDGVGRGGGGGGRRADRVFGRDCQLMGLTWLLARNRTAYIPTVSAVLRAILYSSHPPQYRCSPDQENMPLAVDSLEFERLHTSAAAAAMVPARGALRPAAAAAAAAAAVFSSLLLLRSSFLTL